MLFGEKLEIIFQRLQTVMLGVKTPRLFITEEETFPTHGICWLTVT